MDAGVGQSLSEVQDRAEYKAKLQPHQLIL